MVREMFSLLLRQYENKPRPPLNPELCITSGGSHLDAALTTKVKNMLGAEVIQGYGTTETLPILGNFPGRNRHGSLGISMVAANRVAILDPHGHELPPGEQNIGEICVMGPTVTDGFLNRPQDSAQFFRDGWFHTGDLGWRDTEGFFYFIGRRIAFTKMAAQMVDLVEIEHLVESHPAVEKARTLVKEDERHGEYLVVSVMLNKGMGTDNRTLRDHCKKYLSPHKVPKRFNIYSR
jgi:long-chain acyl-CoA synthetase